MLPPKEPKQRYIYEIHELRATNPTRYMTPEEPHTTWWGRQPQESLLTPHARRTPPKKHKSSRQKTKSESWRGHASGKPSSSNTDNTMTHICTDEPQKSTTTIEERGTRIKTTWKSNTCRHTLGWVYNIVRHFMMEVYFWAFCVELKFTSYTYEQW